MKRPIRVRALNLSKIRIKILKLFVNLQVKNKGKFSISVEEIYKTCKCSEKSVHKFFIFNKKHASCLFEKKAVFYLDGAQAKNEFDVNEILIENIEW